MSDSASRSDPEVTIKDRCRSSPASLITFFWNSPAIGSIRWHTGQLKEARKAGMDGSGSAKTPFPSNSEEPLFLEELCAKEGRLCRTRGP